MPRPWTWLKIGMIVEWICFAGRFWLGLGIDHGSEFIPVEPIWFYNSVGIWLLGTILLFFCIKWGVLIYIGAKIVEWNLIGFDSHGSTLIELLICAQWWVFGCALFLVFGAQAATRPRKTFK